MLPSPAGREASPGIGAPPYVRHRPERTLLYQLVEEYYPAFKAHLAAQDNALPGYVEQDFEDYLECGRLERGFYGCAARAATANICLHSRVARSRRLSAVLAQQAMKIEVDEGLG